MSEDREVKHSLLGNIGHEFRKWPQNPDELVEGIRNWKIEDVAPRLERGELFPRIQSEELTPRFEHDRQER